MSKKISIVILTCRCCKKNIFTSVSQMYRDKQYYCYSCLNGFLKSLLIEKMEESPELISEEIYL